MIYIHKKENSKSNLHYEFTIKENEIKVFVKKSIDELSVKDNEFIISIDDIRSSSFFSSCTIWAFRLDNGRPIQLLKDTLASKMSMSEYSQTIPFALHSFFITVPHMEADFHNCIIMVENGSVPDSDNITKFRYIDEINKNPKLLTFPEIILEQKTEFIDNVSVISMYVQKDDGSIHDGTFEIYLESHVGYLPVRYFRYTGIPIEFKVSSDLLDKNTIIKIKAGYKYFSGVSKLELEVK